MATSPPGSIAETSRGSREILLLNSYHKGFKWTDDITSGILSALPGRNGNDNLHVEYMDTKRFAGGEYLGMLERIYRHKSVKFSFDLIISSDNNAFEFLKKYRDRIFPGVPVVFCGVNYFTDRDLTGFSNVTGVNEAADMKTGFELLLKLHPETREIVFITDATTTGKRVRTELDGIMPGFEKRVKFTIFDHIPMETLLAKLRKLSDGTVVYYTVFSKDGKGDFFEYDRSTALVTKNCPVPVYGAWDFSLGAGIVGGMLTSGTAQGKKAAELALKILEGTPASSLPVVRKSPNLYMFDFNLLEKFDIPMDSLPKDSIVINRSYSFFDKHRKLIAGSILLFLAMAAVITLLAANIVMRRLAEKSLQEKQLEFKALFDSTYQFIMVVDTKGRFIEVNRTALETIEATREVLMGMPLGEAPWWSDDPETRAEVEKSLEKALMGEFVRKELKFSTPVGAITHVDFTLKPVKDQRGNIKLLIAEGRDISEQKQNEAIILDKKSQIEKIINTVPMMVFAKDIEGRYLLANRAMSGIYGLPPEEIMGKRHVDLHRSHSLSEVKRFVNDDREVIEKGVGKLTGRETITRKDGSVRVIQVSKIPFTYDGKKSALGVAMDVTELTCALEAVRLNETRMESLLAINNMEIESTGKILNRALEEALRITQSSLGYLAMVSGDETRLTMYSWSEEAMEQCRIIDPPPEYLVAETGLWGEAIRQRMGIITNDFEADNPLKKGLPNSHLEILRHMNIPVFDGRRIVALAGVGNKDTPYNETDMQQLTLLMSGVWKVILRNEAEAGLRRLNDELEQRVMERTRELEESLEILKETQKQLVEAEKMSALGTLVAGVAHEINTPLGICLTEASFIERKMETLIHAASTGAMTRDDFHGSSGKVLQATKSMLESLEKTAELIQEFKQVAVGETFEEKRVFNVRDYLEDALRSLHGRIERMGHRVTILCPGDLSINSYADTFSLIITNFLMNSVDHGFKGMEKGEIGIRVVKREDELLIGYRDNGRGMEKETCERIFEPFFTTSRGRGRGLGMHLVYNLVTQRLGGSIRCKSFVGEGVEFIITLPFSS